MGAHFILKAVFFRRASDHIQHFFGTRVRHAAKADDTLSTGSSNVTGGAKIGHGHVEAVSGRVELVVHKHLVAHGKVTKVGHFSHKAGKLEVSRDTFVGARMRRHAMRNDFDVDTPFVGIDGNHAGGFGNNTVGGFVLAQRGRMVGYILGTQKANFFVGCDDNVDRLFELAGINAASGNDGGGERPFHIAATASV